MAKLNKSSLITQSPGPAILAEPSPAHLFNTAEQYDRHNPDCKQDSAATLLPTCHPCCSALDCAVLRRSKRYGIFLIKFNTVWA